MGRQQALAHMPSGFTPLHPASWEMTAGLFNASLMMEGTQLLHMGRMSRSVEWQKQVQVHGEVIEKSKHVQAGKHAAPALAHLT